MKTAQAAGRPGAGPAAPQIGSRPLPPRGHLKSGRASLQRPAGDLPERAKEEALACQPLLCRRDPDAPADVQGPRTSQRRQGCWGRPRSQPRPDQRRGWVAGGQCWARACVGLGGEHMRQPSEQLSIFAALPFNCHWSPEPRQVPRRAGGLGLAGGRDGRQASALPEPARSLEVLLPQATAHPGDAWCLGWSSHSAPPAKDWDATG